MKYLIISWFDLKALDIYEYPWTYKQQKLLQYFDTLTQHGENNELKIM